MTQQARSGAGSIMRLTAVLTGAICGQLAGAYWGESGIREERLARKDMIGRGLAELLK